jgi:hypothetical protein
VRSRGLDRGALAVAEAGVEQGAPVPDPLVTRSDDGQGVGGEAEMGPGARPAPMLGPFDQPGTQVWGWCLMPNHVHLILVPERLDGLAAALAPVHRRYTLR